MTSLVLNNRAQILYLDKQDGQIHCICILVFNLCKVIISGMVKSEHSVLHLSLPGHLKS